MINKRLIRTDESGVVTTRYRFDAFGNLTKGRPNHGMIHAFNGEKYHVATGYQFLRARFYDKSTGRFLTRDTFLGWEDNPLSINRYSYVHNDPVNYVDPQGLSAEPVGRSMIPLSVSDLRRVQSRLNQLGFRDQNGRHLATTGVRNAATNYAISQFRIRNNLGVGPAMFLRCPAYNRLFSNSALGPLSGTTQPPTNTPPTHVPPHGGTPHPTPTPDPPSESSGGGSSEPPNWATPPTYVPSHWGSEFSPSANVPAPPSSNPTGTWPSPPGAGSSGAPDWSTPPTFVPPNPWVHPNPGATAAEQSAHVIEVHTQNVCATDEYMYILGTRLYFTRSLYERLSGRNGYQLTPNSSAIGKLVLGLVHNLNIDNVNVIQIANIVMNHFNMSPEVRGAFAFQLTVALEGPRYLEGADGPDMWDITVSFFYAFFHSLSIEIEYGVGLAGDVTIKGFSPEAGITINGAHILDSSGFNAQEWTIDGGLGIRVPGNFGFGISVNDLQDEMNVNIGILLPAHSSLEITDVGEYTIVTSDTDFILSVGFRLYVLIGGGVHAHFNSSEFSRRFNSRLDSRTGGN